MAMDISQIIFPAILGALGFFISHFLVYPILELEKLRQEIHQKIIEYGNIWGLPQQNHPEFKYFIERMRNAANDYRVLASRLEAFQENVENYCPAKYFLVEHRGYNFTDACKGLWALESDALEPESEFRNEQIDKIRKALKIRNVSEKTRP
ncbi:MAG: hypothetical protein GC131_04585 [Alphaproteobacteria bacterium]|nr:hypothetical protein [Alphaproteobacteria bacterium]